MSQISMWPSRPNVASCLPSGLNSMEQAGVSSSMGSRPPSVSQSWIPPVLKLASVVPSGLKPATSPAPSSTSCWRPDAVSHSRIVPSVNSVASIVPSWFNTNDSGASPASTRRVITTGVFGTRRSHTTDDVPLRIVGGEVAAVGAEGRCRELTPPDRAGRFGVEGQRRGGQCFDRRRSWRRRDVVHLRRVLGDDREVREPGIEQRFVRKLSSGLSPVRVLVCFVARSWTTSTCGEKRSAGSVSRTLATSDRVVREQGDRRVTIAEEVGERRRLRVRRGGTEGHELCSATSALPAVAVPGPWRGAGRRPSTRSR